MPVLPRGAGSSQCGQTVGAALVIDHSKHLNRDRRVRPRGDDRHRRARRRARRAQCVAEAARPVVSGRRQHVGASHAGRHGRQQLVRLALDRLRQHGAQRARDRRAARRRHRSMRFGPEAEMDGASPRVADAGRRACARSARASATRSSAACRRCCAASAATTSTSFMPQSERPYTADGSVNFAHLLVGSEGTLAWTRALTLKLAPLPAHRTLGVVNFPTLYRAMQCAQHIVDARAVGRRAGRPHDDRARARQSRVPAGHRRRADRRAAKRSCWSSSSATTRRAARRLDATGRR